MTELCPPIKILDKTLARERKQWHRQTDMPGVEQCRATMRDVMVNNIAMQRVRCTPGKINETDALFLSSVRAYQNKPMSIYISFYLLMDFILFIKVAFHA